MAIIVYYQKKEVMVCSEIPADAKTFSNPFVDHVSCVATALALKARKKGHRCCCFSISTEAFIIIIFVVCKRTSTTYYTKGGEYTAFSYFNMLAL